MSKNVAGRSLRCPYDIGRYRLVGQASEVNAYSRCLSDLVVRCLNRLLDTGSGELLQKKGLQGNARIRVGASALFRRFQEVEATNTSLKEIRLGL